MTTRTITIVIIALAALAAIALQPIGAAHYGAAFAKLEHGVFKLLIGIGLLTTLLAVFPPVTGGASFARAADLSRLSLDIRVARPALMRVGMILLGIGLIGTGLVNLLGNLL